MTLRVTLEIVPFGEEELSYPIYRVDIHNIGIVRNMGFGNVICKYKVEVFKHNNEAEQRTLEAPEWELQSAHELPEHNRRDGALVCLQKVLNIIEERAE